MPIVIKVLSLPYTGRTRETAVLFAFLVAGATQKLAQFCREGRIRECSCSQSTHQHKDAENNLIFESCGENITWASEYIQTFSILPYEDMKINDIRSKCDQHNIKVGTMVRFQNKFSIKV